MRFSSSVKKTSYGPAECFALMTIEVGGVLEEVFCKKRHSLKSRKFHRKTPVLESLFNKVAGLRAGMLRTLSNI